MPLIIVYIHQYISLLLEFEEMMMIELSVVKSFTLLCKVPSLCGSFSLKISGLVKYVATYKAKGSTNFIKI